MENERQSQSERESIRETKREKKIERNGKEGESEMIGKGDGMERISNTVTVSRALCLFFYLFLEITTYYLAGLTNIFASISI